jgi:hypothetical protein
VRKLTSGSLPSDVPDAASSGPPTTPEGLNDPFAVDFSEKIVAMRKLNIGGRPQLRRCHDETWAVNVPC